MLILIALLASLLSATSVTIAEPIDGEIYNGDWLPLRAIVENENVIPDSVTFTLNGSPSALISRLNTDWPTYMQNYLNQGYSESPPPLTDDILWAAPITGTIHEFVTPIVANGIVYYPQDNGGDDFYALDAATGEIVWVFEGTGWTDDAVTVFEDRVYTASDSLFCLNALTGELIWSNGIANAFGGTPVVFDGMVFCAGYAETDSVICTLCCLDAETGDTIWTNTYLHGFQSCMAIHDGLLFVPSHSFEYDCPLYAFDYYSGEVVWSHPGSGNGFWDSSPAVVDGVLYIGDCAGILWGIATETGETVWQNPISNEAINATPAYYDGRLYLGDMDDTYHCIDALSGSTDWTVPGVDHGSSGIAQDVLFYGEGIFYQDSASVIAMNCSDGTEIWRFTTTCSDFGFQSSPSITDGVMYYACTDGYLYAFGTGLKYTYREDFFYADIGSNELIVTSWDNGIAASADTISFTVTQTGIDFEPSRYLELCASPNPVSTNTMISFKIDEPGMVSLSVFDLSGRQVYVILEEGMLSGTHSVQWNGAGDDGQLLSSGLYICRIEHGGVVETTGLCVLR